MTGSAPTTSAITHHLFVKQLRDVVGLWLLFVAAVVVVTGLVAAFTDVTISAWEMASGIPRWFVLGWGVYLTAVYLPLYIAHGYTRREFAARALPFVPAFAAVIGVLMALGFTIEWAVYRLMGWTQELAGGPALYDAPTQFHLIALHQWLVLVAWIVVGALAGAGGYRGVRWGVGSIAAGLAVLATVSSVLGSRASGPGEVPGLGFLASSVPLGASAYVVAVTVAVALTWLAIRDLPIRTRNT